MSDEAGDMVSALVSMLELANQRIAKEYRGQGIPDGGWKVLKQDVRTGRLPGWELIVMRRHDGKRFRIIVEDA